MLYFGIHYHLANATRKICLWHRVCISLTRKGKVKDKIEFGSSKLCPNQGPLTLPNFADKLDCSDATSMPINKHFSNESPGLVVIGGDSCSRGLEFESHHQDGYFLHLSVVKIVLLFEKIKYQTNIGRKWPIKNISPMWRGNSNGHLPNVVVES